MGTAIPHLTTLGLIGLLSFIGQTSACSADRAAILNAERLRSSEGLAEWQQQEAALKGELRGTSERYGREGSLAVLQTYEKAVRSYLDHGFALYRAYRSAHQEPPADLVPSLEQRTALLMDVAEEYIKQGSLAMGEGIAADVVHNYSDLPTLAPAQRRAEAVLLRYRYRQDY